jgi:hypothetical protein
MEYISQLELLNQLALRRLSVVERESSFMEMEKAIFQLEERDALDYDMLKSVLAPYARTAVNIDETGGPNENDHGFDVLDLVIDTVSPEAFGQLELLKPHEAASVEEADVAFEGYWQFKQALFFAILEFHFGIYDANDYEPD